ncbi:MAG: HvfC/BufC family peptide modification chaperone [Stenotrophobium sp.]
MSPLASLQKEFQRYVHHRDGAMQTMIVGDVSASAQERLDIYADAYRLRLLEVLGNDFKGLRALARAKKFEQICRDYIEAHPSPHSNVRWYGDSLAQFLREAAQWNTQPALAEMATLDWAISIAFDARDQAVLALDAVAAIPPPAWPGMQPVLNLSVQCLKQHGNVADIRKAADQKKRVPKLTSMTVASDWLVWRKEMEVFYRAVTPDEAAALSACISGACFAELCEVLLGWHEEANVAMRAATLLRRWVEDEMICAIELPPQP